MSTAASQVQLAFAKKCYDDPVFFANHVLGVTLEPYQERILRSVRDYHETCVHSNHASGKSYCASIVVLWFGTTRKPAIIFSTAPTFRQVETVLWKEIGKLHRQAKIPLPGLIRKIPRWEIGEKDHFAFGFSTDNPDAAQGLHSDNVLGIFDEASGIPAQVWEATKGNLAGGFARLLALGNPTDPTSTFFNHCLLPAVNAIPVSAFDTPNFTKLGITMDDFRDPTQPWRLKTAKGLPAPYLVTPQYVYEMFVEYGEGHPAFIARVLGRFPQVVEDALIPWHAIEDAVERWKGFNKNTLRFSKEPVEIGLDVADGGNDFSVVCIKQGAYVHEIKTRTFAETMETAGFTAEHALRWHAKSIKVDAIGVGSGVCSRLAEQNFPVSRVNFGAGARKREKFKNMRAECYWALREAFVTGRIMIPPDKQLMQELAHTRIKYLSTGQIQIIPKDEIKAEIGRSPDRADALCYAFSDHLGYGIADSSDDDEERDWRDIAEEDAEDFRERTLRTLLGVFGHR